MADSIVDVVVDQIVSRVCEKMSGKSAWIDQSGAPFYDRSPLGRNRHIAAVRRRCQELPPERWGCTRIGRRYLLSPEALAEELRRHMFVEPVTVVKAKPEPEKPAIVERIQARIARRRANGA